TSGSWDGAVSAFADFWTSVARPSTVNTGAHTVANFLRVTESENIKDLLLLRIRFHTFRLRQRENENVTSRGDTYVLLAFNCIPHGCGADILTSVELPPRHA